MSQSSTATKSILITGASTGLGLALAQRLIACGDFHLILTARTESLHRFQQAGITEGPNIWIRKLDILSARERRAISSEITNTFDSLYALINNAGIAYRSVVEHVCEEERLHQMAVNFRGPLELTRLLLPGMRKALKGRIINISSVGGMMAMPTMAVYSASKFALEGASEALYYEVKPWNINVTLVQPGLINSDAFEKVPYTRLSKRSSETPADPYYVHYNHMSGFIKKIMKRSPASPDSVARVVENVLRHRNPPLRVSGSIDARIFSVARRLLPSRFYHWLLYRSLPGIQQWGPKKRGH